MRQTLQLDWDFLEIEKEEEWVDVTATTATEDANRPHGRGDKRAWLSIAALVAIAVAIVGFRLWLIAEEGAAAIERDLGALTQTETITKSKFSTHDLPATAVESVHLNVSGAMVCVVVTETVASGERLTYMETRFYKPIGNQWRRTAPISSFWGRAAELDTATLHFDFYSLDRPYVEAIDEPLEAYHQALRGLLGLPAPTQPLTVTIVPASIARRVNGPDGAIMLSSPLLYHVATERARTATLMDLTREMLTTKTIDEAISRYHVPPRWQPHVAVLHTWILLRYEDLPRLLSSEAECGRQSGYQCSPYTFGAMLTDYDYTDDYFYVPGYAEYRGGQFAIAGQSFFDCLVYCDRIDAVPALLAGFGHHMSWATLAPDVFGVSLEELGRLSICDADAADLPLSSP